MNNVLHIIYKLLRYSSRLCIRFETYEISMYVIDSFQLLASFYRCETYEVMCNKSPELFGGILAFFSVVWPA
jgi:hypothetical protein